MNKVYEHSSSLFQSNKKNVLAAGFLLGDTKMRKFCHSSGSFSQKSL